MPKIALPELQALEEYLTGKVPRLGMFSTLKGLIDNSPKDVATAQEWAGYFKPGQIATRAGIEFPLKKEELDYSGIPDLLSNVKPNEKITRDQILQTYLKNAPDLNLHLGSQDAIAGNTPENLAAARQGITLGDRLIPDEGQYAQYSHAERAAPKNSSNPFGSDQYQVSVTKGTPEQIGETEGHFGLPNAISWSRTNRLPMDPFPPGTREVGNDPGDYQGRMMRLIDEIQSDRHQAAIKKEPQPLEAEALARANELARNLGTAHDPQLVRAAFSNDIDPQRMTDPDYQALINDPHYQELQKVTKGAAKPVGYQPPNAGDQAKALWEEITRLQKLPRVLTVDREGGLYPQRDPEIEKQLENLQGKLDLLNKAVPDTPFKTTQGYVGLEMRKALNDALQSGDSALGLASGEDQSEFYGNRFNPDQSGGQNYNYNTSYPSVLRDLARRYNLPYGPQTTHFAANSTGSSMWPPPRMANSMMHNDGYEEPTLENFIKYSQDRDIIDPTDEAPVLRRMYRSLLEPMNEEEFGFSHNSEDVEKAYAQMKNNRAKMNIIEWDSANHNVQPGDRSVDQPEYQQLAQDQDVQRKIIHGALGEVFDAYKDAFGPGAAPQPTTVPKTFQNAIDLGDADAVAKAKQAGVPIWHTGGSVDGEFDHIGHAIHRIKLTEPQPAEMADGGAVEDDSGNVFSEGDAQAAASGTEPSDLPERAGYAMRRHFYGPDSSGQMTLLPGRSTLGLKEMEGIPYRLSQLLDTVSGTPPLSAAPKGLTPEQAQQWTNQKLAESTPLAGSKNAAQEAETTGAALRQQSGIPEAHTFLQHLADNADAVVPIPGLKTEGTLSHLLGYLGGASPKNYPRMLTEWAGANAAIASLLDKVTGKKPPQQPVEKADGGQPDPTQSPAFDPDTADSATVENQEQNDMMMRRMLQRSAPVVPLPTTPMASGGPTDIRHALAILQSPFTAGKPPGLIPAFNHTQTSMPRASHSSQTGQSEDLSTTPFGAMNPAALDMLRSRYAE